MSRTVQRIPSSPSKYRVGQLVEASMSFRAVHVGRGKIFLTRLDSLLLANRIGTAVSVRYTETPLVQVYLMYHPEHR